MFEFPEIVLSYKGLILRDAWVFSHNRENIVKKIGVRYCAMVVVVNKL